ncbi:MAG: hypothetical protein ACK5V3_07665 [Bdellovibrionales bacterium]
MSFVADHTSYQLRDHQDLNTILKWHRDNGYEREVREFYSAVDKKGGTVFQANTCRIAVVNK